MKVVTQTLQGIGGQRVARALAKEDAFVAVFHLNKVVRCLTVHHAAVEQPLHANILRIHQQWC